MANALEAISQGKAVGYIRVSTVDQNTDRQLADIPLDKIFIEKISSREIHRPQLEAALDYLREDDTLYVHSMDRLARKVDELREIVRSLVSRGVTVRFVKENMTFSPKGNTIFDQLMLTMLGAFAEFELSIRAERQLEGIRNAKPKGVYKGRKPSLNKEDREKLYRMLDAGIPKAEAGRRMKISRTTVYDYIELRTETPKGEPS